MKVDAICLDLRPRGMLEAADLGVRLVSAHPRSVWASFAPVYAFALLLAAAALPLGIGWAVLMLIWLKPWLDRPILFALARSAFGEKTRFADLWAARRGVFVQGLAGALTVRRLSPWRSYVQPVLQLEGQHGKARRQRVARILGQHRGAALAMQSAFATVESALTLGAISLFAWFLPADDRVVWWRFLFAGNGWATAMQLSCYAAAVLVLEPFFVGAGFAMYLNRRVELEAWDIEQEFRLAFAR
ncbi:MAG TPA: hypothetical protein VH041_08510 [Caldimonas sp.]|jgi:hypothetical protein|nr:hypothetical protein [Caldimonas sp.]HEX4234337.1 hypothetical protein [Caldimonas sp.]